MLDIPYKYRLLLLFFIAFWATVLVFNPILKIAKCKGIVDNPGIRKIQKIPIPVMGGVAVFFGIVVGLCFFKTMVEYTSLFPVLGAMMIMLYMGSIDDILNINPKVRIVIEIFVSLLIIYGLKCCISDFQGMWYVHHIPLFVGIPLSVLTFVGIVNAINMIDGIDGLSSSFCIFIIGSLGVVCFLSHDYSFAVLAAVAIGALLPFFLHNVFGVETKMFIGDGGTMMIGTMISSMVFIILRTGTGFPEFPVCNFNRIAYCIAVLSFPIADTLRVMFVRAVLGKSPFSPDKNHFHHILLKYGFSNISIVAIEIFLNIVVVVVFLLTCYLQASPEIQLFVVIFLSAILNWGIAYVINMQYKSKTKLYYKIERLSEKTHLEQKPLWLKFQRIIDRS